LENIAAYRAEQECLQFGHKWRQKARPSQTG
jgi:hypothetical protein